MVTPCYCISSCVCVMCFVACNGSCYYGHKWCIANDILCYLKCHTPVVFMLQKR